MKQKPGVAAECLLAVFDGDDAENEEGFVRRMAGALFIVERLNAIVDLLTPPEK